MVAYSDDLGQLATRIKQIDSGLVKKELCTKCSAQASKLASLVAVDWLLVVVCSCVTEPKNLEPHVFKFNNAKKCGQDADLNIHDSNASLLYVTTTYCVATSNLHACS